TASTSSPSRAKSAERIDGAIQADGEGDVMTRSAYTIETPTSIPPPGRGDETLAAVNAYCARDEATRMPRECGASSLRRAASWIRAILLRAACRDDSGSSDADTLS